VEQPNRKSGSELLEKGVPVFENTAGTDHESLRVRITIGEQAQHSHHLVGFAEPHVVGQQGADSDQVPAPQPGNSCGLVGPELGAESGRTENLLARASLEYGRELSELLVGSFHRKPRLGHQTDESNPAAKHPEIAAALRHLEAELFQEFRLRSTDDRFTDAGESAFDQNQCLGPWDLGIGGLVPRPHSDFSVGSVFSLERNRCRELRLAEGCQLSLRQVPGVLSELRMIEVEEPQGFLALENPTSLAVKWHQRRCRVEQATEMGADSRPSAVDAAVEARAGENLTGAEAIARFENDALFVPGRGEHRP
jgi:hypothetical protein